MLLITILSFAVHIGVLIETWQFMSLHKVRCRDRKLAMSTCTVSFMYLSLQVHDWVSRHDWTYRFLTPDSIWYGYHLLTGVLMITIIRLLKAREKWRS